MKKILFFYSFIFLIFISCTSGEDDNPEIFSVFIKNSTGVPFRFRVILVDGEVSIDENVINGDSILFCRYMSLSGFSGAACERDFFEILFANNRGYRCINAFDGTPMNTCRMGLITTEKFINTENNNYEISITEEDFENAFDLSEQ